LLLISKGGEACEGEEGHLIEEKDYWTDPLPMHLPSMGFITPEMMSMAKYGLSSENLKVHIQDEIQAFESWETNGIQLNRVGVYSKKVQVTTTTSHKTLIQSYLGFLSFVLKRPQKKLTLANYQGKGLSACLPACLPVLPVWQHGALTIAW
jgi:hypothetical protein